MKRGAPDAVTGCLRYGTLQKVKSFPAAVRQEPGKAIFDLQRGETLAMPLSRPVPSIALGAEELRIRDRAGIYCVFCYARLARGVLVFHAFTRKTQSTPKNELAKGKKRGVSCFMKETKAVVAWNAGELAKPLGLTPADGAKLELQSDLNTKGSHVASVVRVGVYGKGTKRAAGDVLQKGVW